MSGQIFPKHYHKNEMLNIVNEVLGKLNMLTSFEIKDGFEIIMKVEN